MAEQDPKRPPRSLRITAPGRDGGMLELIAALAAIVARLEREERERQASETPPLRPPHT